jgi:hypothetical protein
MCTNGIEVQAIAPAITRDVDRFVKNAVQLESGLRSAIHQLLKEAEHEQMDQIQLRRMGKTGFQR